MNTRSWQLYRKIHMGLAIGIVLRLKKAEERKTIEPQKIAPSGASNNDPNLQSPPGYQSRPAASAPPSAMQPPIPDYLQYPSNVATDSAAGSKSYLVVFLLSLFLGSLGADRFYLGYFWTGVLKLLTLGGLGVWYLIDLVTVYSGRKRAKDGSPLGGREEDKRTATISLVVMLLISLALIAYYTISAASFFKALDNSKTKDGATTATIGTSDNKAGESNGGTTVTPLGSAASVENFSIRVTRVTSSPKTTGDTPDVGRQYLQIDLSLANTGGEDTFVPGSFFYKTSTGEESLVADTFGNQGFPNKSVQIDGRQSMAAAVVGPGKTDDTKSLIFQVPKGDKGQLVWRSGTLDPDSTLVAVFQLF